MNHPSVTVTREGFWGLQASCGRCLTIRIVADDTFGRKIIEQWAGRHGPGKCQERSML